MGLAGYDVIRSTISTVYNYILYLSKNLAIAFKILASYRNLVKYREPECGSPSKTNNWL
jgi:hypothetical protein